jgi:pyrroloquinoline quinone biosynthesis protein B
VPLAQRGTPIAGCVLTDAEIDHTSGLLQLREGCRFSIFSTPLVRRWLTQYLPIGPILAPFADRPWTDLPLETWLRLPLPSGEPSGLRLWAFDLGPDVPRFVPESTADQLGVRVGLTIESDLDGSKLVYAPGVSEINEPLRAAAKWADCLLMDGTFWSDDEPQQMGISRSTAREMGHLPVSGFDGSLAWLCKLSFASIRYRVYVHINNTNPMLYDGGPERREVQAAGVHVGMDGDMFVIGETIV